MTKTSATKIAMLVIGCALALHPITSFAEMTGNELHRLLEAKSVSALYYIHGVMDGAAISRTMVPDSAKNEIRVLNQVWGCIPENATLGQAKDIVADHLKKSPQIRHLTASTLVAAALSGAWPCP